MMPTPSLLQPCDECIVGVLETLPVAKSFSLKQLYDQAIEWTLKYQDRIWVLRQFAKLQQDIIDDCVKQAESELVRNQHLPYKCDAFNQVLDGDFAFFSAFCRSTNWLPRQTSLCRAWRR